jgi:hypothetical protein
MSDNRKDRDAKGRFDQGNQIWRERLSHGRPPIFTDATALWDACVGYFEWNEANPLFERKAFSNGATADIPKMRAMTLSALWLYLGIDRTTWAEWRERPDLSTVTSHVDSIIRVQKFEGAAAGLLCANIIARDLGLADKSENKTEHAVTDEASEYMRLAVGTAFGRHKGQARSARYENP